MPVATEVDLKHDYLTTQIIAYIGNKRSLLSLIRDAVVSLYGTVPAGLKFLDAFAGSGVVSRLAKFLGCEVYSNDWEYFSYVINRGYVEFQLSDIDRLFGSEEALSVLLAELNRLPDPPENEQYIARYYAPAHRDIDKADYRTERLFYTRDNALAIDKIRNRIEMLFPPQDTSPDNRLRHDFLVSLLIYQAATHTNTSGVFKACHKGFGGHSGDALTRILAPVHLEIPALIDSVYPCHIFREDSNQLLASGRLPVMDIVYLDPPYNQHQYGSNYHMLNTVALWDKIPAPLTLNSKGVLQEKAAIRKDWQKTRSSYCYKDSAAAAFRKLLDGIAARHILVSYSTDGIIPFNLMQEICCRKGKVKLFTNEYTKYRGGKQSNSRLNTNVEFILIIDTAGRNTKHSLGEVNRIIRIRKLLLLFKNKYSRYKLEANFSIKGNEIITGLKSSQIAIKTTALFELHPPENELAGLSDGDIDILQDKLQASLCQTREEELEEILSRIDGHPDNDKYFLKWIPYFLKKLAHKKNKEQFYTWCSRIQDLEQEIPISFSLIKDKLEQVKALAEMRFQN